MGSNTNTQRLDKYIGSSGLAANAEYFRLEKERFLAQAREAEKLEVFYKLKGQHNDLNSLAEFVNLNRSAKVVYRAAEGDFVAIGYIDGYYEKIHLAFDEEDAENWCEDWVLCDTE